MTDSDRGVLYMATGEQFIDESCRSAQSVKEHMPNLPVAIATDHPNPPGPFDIVIDYEFQTETINGRSWLINSTVTPDLLPWQRTLLLDSDTLVLAELSCIFDLLDDYDLAVARPTGQPTLDSFPDPFRQLNCGVMALADTEPTQTVLQNWRENYHRDLQDEGEPVDQPAFAKALYGSDARWFCLPPEYNVRVSQRGAITNDAKIIHGRHPAGLEQAAEELNRCDGPRVFRERSAGRRSVFVVHDRGTLRYHAEETITKHGVRTLLAAGAAYFLDRLDGGDRMSAFRGTDLG